MSFVVSFDALPPQPPRRLLLINGEPASYVTQDEFNEIWASDFAGMIGYENIECVDLSFVATVDVAAPRSLPLEFAVSHLKELVRQQDEMIELFRVLSSRLTDASHLTVAEVAKLRNVTERTVRSWIARGIFELEAIPHSRESGIRTEAVFNAWLPSRLLKTTSRGVR